MTKTISGKDVQIGDTIKIWRWPFKVTIKELVYDVQSYGEDRRVADFWEDIDGMLILDREEYELIDRPGGEMNKAQFINSWNLISKEVHENAVKHGFWEGDRNDAECIALMHSELSEALEALRHGDKNQIEEELADVVIRIMDYAEARKLNIPRTIYGKHQLNLKREYKHGKRF